MSTPELDDTLNAERLFTSVFEEAEGAVNQIESLRTVGYRANTGEINVPMTNLVVVSRSMMLDEASGEEVASTHVGLSGAGYLEGLRHPAILSTTVYYADHIAVAEPLSVGVYRGEERLPDYFLKQSPKSSLVICKLGSTGLNGDGIPEDENVGETSLSPNTRIGDIDDEDKERISTVVQVIKERIVALSTVAVALEGDSIRGVIYTGGEPKVTYWPAS